MYEIIVSIKLAFSNLRSNVGRTTFSLLGIVIGVTSVVLILSFGLGVKNFVVGQITSFGTDIIGVEIKVPKTKHVSAENIAGVVGGTQITTFKLEDAEELAELPNIGDWYAWIIGQEIVSYESEKRQAYVIGATPGIIKVDEQMEIASGKMYTEDDEEGLKQVAVLGSKTKERFFGDEEAVGKNIKIRGKSYKVVGVLKERGFITYFDFDSIIFVPLRTLQKKVLGVDHIPEAVYKIEDMRKVDVTVLEVERKMRDLHDITNPDDDDFSVASVAEFKDILDQVFVIINALLLALTSISLIVGGVGIMNVMYVAVTERTYEIGLRKSVGAKNSDILLQFLFEAVFLTLLGGIIGVAAGAVVSQLAETIAANFGFILRFTITWWSVAIGFGFAAATGIIFGYYPARKASKMSPMEALRKE